MYWGASLEFQYPFYFLPKDSGFRGAIFVDSGSVWGYKGETQNPATGEINGSIVTCSARHTFSCQCGMQFADDAVDTGFRRRQRDLGFAVRSVALRFRLSVPQAGLRSDPVLRLRRRSALLIAAKALRRTAMPDFFKPNCELTTGEIAALTRAKLREGDPPDRRYSQYRTARHGGGVAT